MLDMDEIDRKLVTLLRHNGRRSIADLSLELDVSRATVRSRMEKLEATGEVLGYTVVLRADTLEQPVRGIVLLEIKGQAADQVVQKLRGFPEVTSVHTTNGRWDLIVEIGTETLVELDAVLRKLRLIPGISGSETNLLLATPVSSKASLAS